MPGDASSHLSASVLPIASVYSAGKRYKGIMAATRFNCAQVCVCHLYVAICAITIWLYFLSPTDDYSVAPHYGYSRSQDKESCHQPQGNWFDFVRFIRSYTLPATGHDVCLWGCWTIWPWGWLLHSWLLEAAPAGKTFHMPRLLSFWLHAMLTKWSQFNFFKCPM